MKNEITKFRIVDEKKQSNKKSFLLSFRPLIDYFYEPSEDASADHKSAVKSQTRESKKCGSLAGNDSEREKGEKDRCQH